MELKNKTKFTVALFIIAAFVIFVVAIFILAGKENLFTSTFRLNAGFETVSGLQSGASVRYNGISVGKVDNIEIVSDRNVKVLMTLDKNVQRFIKQDSKATVSSEGLVGNKIIEIIPGTSTALSVEDNETIQSVKPIDVEDILKTLKETGENARDLTKDLAEVVNKVNEGEGTIGQLINNDQLYRSVDSTMRSYAGYSGQVSAIFRKITETIDRVSTDAEGLSSQIMTITKDISAITKKINSSESIVGTLLTDTLFANNLKDLMQNANSAAKNLERGSYSFSQNMEALKHNFFFKGYFEDIGYWDKDEVERLMERKNRELELLERKIIQRKNELKELEEMEKKKN